MFLNRHSIATGLLWAGIALVCDGQVTNEIIDQFNTNSSSSYVNQDWGAAVPSVSWDDTENAATTLVTNDPGSGSSKWVIAWPTTNDQIMVTRALGMTLNLNQFTSISYDIRFAPSTATDGAGNAGALEIDWVPTADGWPSTANPPEAYVNFPSGNTNWMHVSMPINAAADSNLNAVEGIGFKIQQNRTGANLTGTTTFWLDNIILSGPISLPGTGLAQIAQLNTPQLWQRAEFQITNVPYASNPFDSDVIQLNAAITEPSGETIVVPAFWYQGYERSLSSGTEYDAPTGFAQWRLRFTPPAAGTYSISLAILTNNQPYGTAVTNFTVASNTPPSRFGYVGIAPNRQYFQTGDGQALPLNGEDVAWPSSAATYDYDSYFASMQGSGENFARVWMCPWSFGIEDAPGTLDNYALDPAWQLDYVLQLAEESGIYIQLCLDYHGMFATQPDYWGGNNYWPENPYNVTNGGPCLNANGFFTNATARVIYQKRLRYLIGRYGYSQNLLGWEFFNEIDNDYAFLNAASVAAWHGNMAEWLHTNDVFNHLITTSLTYASEHPEIWSLPGINYSSEHAYTGSESVLSVASDSQYFLQTFAKPIMIGEFGTSWEAWDTADDPYLRGFREGIWSGALGGSVGTSMSWWWQNIASDDDYSVYASLTAILGQTGWGNGPWSNIVFLNGSEELNCIGQKGAHESLIYVVTDGSTFPTGGTNVSLPLQQGETITLSNWPSGVYYADWYDPATATSLGRSTAAATNGRLTLSLPGYTVDLAGIIYPPPTLGAPTISSNGGFWLQITSETGGQYEMEQSSNLASWKVIATVTNALGTTNIFIPQLMTNSAEFYRAFQIQ